MSQNSLKTENACLIKTFLNIFVRLCNKKLSTPFLYIFTGDEARSEHERWNPHCPFLLERSVGNVKLGEEAQNAIGSDATVISDSMQSGGYYALE